MKCRRVSAGKATVMQEPHEPRPKPKNVIAQKRPRVTAGTVSIPAVAASVPTLRPRTTTSELRYPAPVRLKRRAQTAQSFSEFLAIPQYILRSLEEAGITSTTPIQRQTLPKGIAGHDLIGIAQTGSGKTLAFLIPAAVFIEGLPRALVAAKRSVALPLALILVPTRELAIQIEKEAKKLLQYSTCGKHRGGIASLSFYGGGDRTSQLRSAQTGGCHLAVATVGRLADVVRSGEVSLRQAAFLVLDEADKMLDDGFMQDVQWLVGELPQMRRTMFFSATWPQQADELATRLCSTQGDASGPVRVNCCRDAASRPQARTEIVQEVMVFDGEDWEKRDEAKRRALWEHARKVLEDKSHKCLVFVDRKSIADELSNKLCNDGYPAESMHSGRTQRSRSSTILNFGSGETRLLVTTDVMSRGIDIPKVTHVVVYDIWDIEDYVHRIGRTARGPDGSGHALGFFEHRRRQPQIASELIRVLEEAGQHVPHALRR